EVIHRVHWLEMVCVCGDALDGISHELSSFHTRSSAELSRCGASSYPNRVPARTWPPWPPGRCATATSGWSGDRRCGPRTPTTPRSEEHTSELQSREYLVCRLMLENINYRQMQQHDKR